MIYEEGLVDLIGPDGASVPFTQANTRWGAAETRLLRVLPEADLTPGGWYTLRLNAGLETIGGLTSQEPWELTFQVECDATSADDCEDLGDIPVASIDGVPEEDAGDTGAAPDDGCGCMASGAPAGLLPLLLTGLAAVRRRSHS